MVEIGANIDKHKVEPLVPSLRLPRQYFRLRQHKRRRAALTFEQNCAGGVQNLSISEMRKKDLGNWNLRFVLPSAPYGKPCTSSFFIKHKIPTSSATTSSTRRYEGRGIFFSSSDLIPSPREKSFRVRK